jgi:putative Mg2+ transporter-C (MgtC) family protein
LPLYDFRDLRGYSMGWDEVFLRVFAAVVIGTAIGLDRELRRKAAGVRTIGLVSLGAAIATMMVAPRDAEATSRVIQGALTGVGFLGAGVIFRQQTSVEGLTTAASIWLAAVLGAACGLASWPLVIVGTIFALILLVPTRMFWARVLRARRKAKSKAAESLAG